jgi:hypothetical protein
MWKSRWSCRHKPKSTTFTSEFFSVVIILFVRQHSSSLTSFAKRPRLHTSISEAALCFSIVIPGNTSFEFQILPGTTSLRKSSRRSNEDNILQSVKIFTAIFHSTDNNDFTIQTNFAGIITMDPRFDYVKVRHQTFPWWLTDHDTELHLGNQYPCLRCVDRPAHYCLLGLLFSLITLFDNAS